MNDPPSPTLLTDRLSLLKRNDIQTDLKMAKNLPVMILYFSLFLYTFTQ